MTTETKKGKPMLVLEGGTIVDTKSPRVRRADLWIANGKIASVGTPDAGDADVAVAVERIDCEGCLILPGLVCGHGHLYSALASGMPGPAQAPTNFVEILERVWWKLDKALDETSLRSSALVGALGAVRSGTTTIIDHHASPSFIDGSLDVIADALENVGLRNVLCYEVTDRGGVEKRDAGLRENERFLEADRALSRGLVGAHASFTLSAETLEACVDIQKRKGSGMHVHLGEDGADQVDSLEKYGVRVMQRMADAGALGPKTLFAHGVHLDDKERELLASSECWIAHNPRSNMNNSVGYANPMDFGKRVVLGTDGIGADMFAESQHAFFRARERGLSADAAVMLEWLTNGATLVSSLFEQPIGELSPGAAADVIVLDSPTATPLSDGNFPWHWMFGFSSRMVRDVLTGGRVVLRDRRFPHIDEAAILAEARAVAPELWGRM
jgi:putative selenium metabolism protein SsnA